MRLFFALTFSPAARAALRQAQERLRAFAPGARYPGEETLHLTLAFLGEVPDRLVPQAAAVLEGLALSPMTLRFSQAGPLSPEEDLWALFPEECPALFALQGELAALTRLPAFVVYPCYSVGAILVISLCSVLLFHERLSRRQWGAVGMILAAVALLNL